MRKYVVSLLLVINIILPNPKAIKVNALDCSPNNFSVDIVDGVNANLNIGCFVLSENGYTSALEVFEAKKTELLNSNDVIKPNVTISITYSGDNPVTALVESGYSKIIQADRAMAYSQPYYSDTDGTMNIYTSGSLSTAYTYMNARNPLFYFSTFKRTTLVDKNDPSLTISSFSVEISVNGAKGFVKASEVQFVPLVYVEKKLYFTKYDFYNPDPNNPLLKFQTKTIIPKQTYYTVVDVDNVINRYGTYSQPIHQLSQIVTLANSSTSTFPIGKAPEWLPVGTYYSQDGITFYYDIDLKKPIYYPNTTVIAHYYNYYAYNNLRSKTQYSYSDLDAYLAYYISVNPRADLAPSMLFNNNQILINSQDIYGVNAVYILALAGQESSFARNYKAQNQANFTPYANQIVKNATTLEPINYTVTTYCKYFPSNSFKSLSSGVIKTYSCTDAILPLGSSIILDLTLESPINLSVDHFCKIYTGDYDKYADEINVIHYCKGLNNLFGIGVYDDGSSPGNGFASTQACVDYLNGSLLRGYFNYQNYKFYATNIGNKGASINTKYASDPWWSTGVIRYAYYIDRYLGFHDYNSNIIGIKDPVSSVSGKVYKDKELTTLLYEIPTRAMNYPFLVLEGMMVNGKLIYKIQTTNPINDDGSVNVSTSSANIAYNFEKSIGYIEANQITEYISSFITGVTNNGLYNVDKQIFFNNGSAQLNGESIVSGYNVTQEGSYSLVATSLTGARQTIVFTIDKTAPIITLNNYNKQPTNQNIIVTATVNEGLLDTDTITFTENGSFIFKATDEAGNVSERTVTIDNIDLIPPTITIEDFDNTTISATDIIVNAQTNEGTLNTDSYTFMRNGSYTFTATDLAGNVSSKLVTVSNIVKPVLLSYDSELIGGKLEANISSIPVVSGSTVYSTDQVSFIVTLNSKYHVYKWNFNLESLNTRLTTLTLDYPYLDTNVSLEFYMEADLNDDAKVTTTDLVQLRRYIAGLDTPNEKAVLSADVNNDGKVSTTDLVKIRRMLAGLE